MMVFIKPLWVGNILYYIELRLKILSKVLHYCALVSTEDLTCIWLNITMTARELLMAH